MTQSKQTILVSGGAGFIGSHTVVELLQQGFEAIVVDDLSNSSAKVLDRIQAIVGEDAARLLTFYQADIADRAALDAIFSKHAIDAVIHFAGFKAVGESVQKPIEYYTNNIGSTLTLVDVMRSHGCTSIIFSSSATVYGDPDSLPLTEASPKKPATNPYGWTKWMIEQILTDLQTADPTWDVVLLRYFNPIGAHPSGLIGEDPKGIPNNLVPYVAQVAVGKRDAIHVFGDDYDTPDGTGVRDYIHVCDLARGHVAALTWMQGRTGVERAAHRKRQGDKAREQRYRERAANHRQSTHKWDARGIGCVRIPDGACKKRCEWNAVGCKGSQAVGGHHHNERKNQESHERYTGARGHESPSLDDALRSYPR